MDRLGVGRLPGSATFYLFGSMGGFQGTSLDFALHLLLDRQVSVVPGSAYGASTNRFVRNSIGAESEERIEQALEVLRDTIEAGSVDPATVDRSLAKFGLGRFKVPVPGDP